MTLKRNRRYCECPSASVLHVFSSAFVRGSIVPFMATLKGLVTLKKALDDHGLEPEKRDLLGIHVDQVFARLEEVASLLGQPAPVRNEVERTASNALDFGFLMEVPIQFPWPEPRFIATDNYYDLLLFIAALDGFDSMLAVAREDERFVELFKRLDAKEPQQSRRMKVCN
jgi:hypothetical protein